MVTRIFLAAMLVTAAGMLGNCGKGEAGDSGKMKVGLMTTAPTSDGGWNQLAKESLDKAAAEAGVEVRVQQSVEKDKAADALRQFDGQGYALVIAHGFEYQAVVEEMMKGAGLKAKIAVSGGDADSPGFQALDYDLGGASYQLGVIAARVSKTGKLGFIAGDKFPTVTVMLRGFKAGALSVNPQATVADAWPGWVDPSKSKREAEAMIAQGVDVIMQNVDSASRGVFEAVKEHNATGNADNVTHLHADVYTFGANSDQNGNTVCGDYMLASAVIRMDLAFGRVIKQVKDGTFKGGHVKEDLASGVCVAVMNPKLVGTVIDKETEKLVDDAGKKLTSGEVKVPLE